MHRLSILTEKAIKVHLSSRDVYLSSQDAHLSTQDIHLSAQDGKNYVYR